MDLETQSLAMYSMAVQKRAAANEAAGPMRDHLFSEANMCDAVAVKLDQVQDVLRQINTWAGAYPVDTFVPPSPEARAKARDVLANHSLALTEFNVDAMRHIAQGMAKIVNALND